MVRCFGRISRIYSETALFHEKIATMRLIGMEKAFCGPFTVCPCTNYYWESGYLATECARITKRNKIRNNNDCSRINILIDVHNETMAATEGATKGEEEDFLSLEPARDNQKQKSKDAFDGEDFISFLPSDDDENEEAETDSNDASQKTSQHQSRTFDTRTSLPPWMDSYVDHRRTNPLVALHNEIVGFCRLMEPRDDEMKTRNELVAKFTALAESVFDNCKVEIFGSQATGYVDINVVDLKCVVFFLFWTSIH